MKRTISLCFLLVLCMLLSALPTFAADPVEHVYPPAIKEVFVNEELDGYQMPYNLILPTDYDETKDYPVFMLLHGAGERGNDNELQMFHGVDEMFTTRPELMAQTIILVPQCPEGEQWVDWPWENGNYALDEIPESKALQTAIKLLQRILLDYACDTDRVYLMGISMGGFGTWDALVRHEELFAAGVPLCGGGDPSKADILKEIPIWCVHGGSDTTVPFAGTKDMAKAITAAGGERITFTAMAGYGHNIWDAATTDGELIDWLFAQNLTLRYPHPVETEAPETEAPQTEAVTATATAVLTEEPETASAGGIGGAAIAIVLAVAVAVIVPFAIVLGKKKAK